MPSGTGSTASRSMIATPASSLPWIAPTAITRVPSGSPRRMTVIGRPSTERPISISVSTGTDNPSIAAICGSDGIVGVGATVDVLVVEVDVVVGASVVGVVVLVVVVVVVVRAWSWSWSRRPVRSRPGC